MRNYYMLFLVYLFLCLNSMVLHANSDSGLGFTYENKMPDNQISNNSYFELKVSPGDEQTLITTLYNSTNQDKTIQLSVHDATSSSSGDINYTSTNNTPLTEDIFWLSNMIDAPETIILKANSSQNIELKLKVPDTPFQGMILGGIQLKEVQDDVDLGSDEGVVVQNQYAYTYSISLIEEETFIENNILCTDIFFQNQLHVEFENTAPIIATPISINFLIKPIDSNKVLHEYVVKNYRMAPNSKLSIPIEGSDVLNSGEYRLEANVKVDSDVFNFEKKFRVEDNLAITEHDSESLTIEKEIKLKKSNSFLFGMVIVFIALFIAIYFLVQRIFNRII